jgi:hypothetical protein
MPMGNLRDADYDFNKIWHSKRATEVREHIKNTKGYFCPIANISYTNILLNMKYMLKVLKNLT